MRPEPHLEPQAQQEPDVNMESLLQDQKDYAAKRGDIRLGRVMEITDSGVLLDIGLKREGFAPIEDLQQMQRAQMAEVHVGDEVPAMIVDMRGSEGYQVSIYRARMEEDWFNAEQLLRSGEILESEISGYNRGGLTVQFGRIRGFIPMSHVVGLPRGLGDPERRERLAAMVGKTVGLRVIEVDRQRRRLILSQRQARRAWQRLRKQRLLNELQEGQRRRGVVSSITNFGIFVDLGGVDGLVHVSELSWRRVDDPHEVARVGDEVEVVVLEVDRSRERVGLSIKKALGDPWEKAGDKYEVNQLVEGRITRVADIGAFVELEPGIEGLLHTSELVGAPNVTPQEVLKEGDVVLLKVLRIELSRRRIGLSARRVRQEEWERWAAERAAREERQAQAEEPVGEPPAKEPEPPAEAVDEAAGEPAEPEPSTEEAQEVAQEPGAVEPPVVEAEPSVVGQDSPPPDEPLTEPEG